MKWYASANCWEGFALYWKPLDIITSAMPYVAKTSLGCYFGCLIKAFLYFEPTGIIVYGNDDFFSLNSYRTVAIFSQGGGGNDSGISGSLGVVCSLAHVLHWLIRSSICLDSPGNQP